MLPYLTFRSETSFRFTSPSLKLELYWMLALAWAFDWLLSNIGGLMAQRWQQSIKEQLDLVGSTGFFITPFNSIIAGLAYVNAW